ncbi:MAG: hypothetical protein HY954_00745 [Deltaproteobacteria bacterium]|nr:hypothetical protein [Deltaproteobacteria bacterium]
MKIGLKSRLASFIFIASFVFSAGTASSTPANAKKPSAGQDLTAGKSASGKVVFDLSHSEIFSPVKKGPLHYTQFYDNIRKSGSEVSLNKKPITPKALERVKTYIIAGPAQPITKDEIETLRNFVNNGGNLLLLLHISGPVAPLSVEFGIVVSNFVISDVAGNINNKSQDFYVTSFARHPVTAGLNKIAVYGTWGLMAEVNAEVLAGTSDKAWADMNRNREFDKDEPTQSFGVIAANEYGKGKVVVVADDAPFANQFIGEADNKKLADNIIRWFKE